MPVYQGFFQMQGMNCRVLGRTGIVGCGDYWDNGCGDFWDNGIEKRIDKPCISKSIYPIIPVKFFA
jgi:hypothetical protein